MTCGIYRLYFKGTDRVYIGQSVNIEKRYRQHTLSMEKGISNYKLQEAYIMYGHPSIEILDECSIEDLDTVEDECISIWNSVNYGFNLYTTANEAPTYKGFGSGNSRYTKEQIVQVFNLLVDTDMPFSDIQTYTGVPSDTTSNISSLVSHIWLKEEYPQKYLLLVSKWGNRSNYTVVSDKLSAKAKGIVYPSIRSPEGIIHTIDNAYKFAKERGLAPNHFQEVLNGHRKSHKGWKLCQKEQVF